VQEELITFPKARGFLIYAILEHKTTSDDGSRERTRTRKMSDVATLGGYNAGEKDGNTV
jgi:hypothetical protein